MMVHHVIVMAKETSAIEATGYCQILSCQIPDTGTSANRMSDGMIVTGNMPYSVAPLLSVLPLS
jgi:hypothetical protein